MKFWPCKLLMLWALGLALSQPCLAVAASSPLIPDDVIYRQNYQGRRFDVSPKEFNFLVDNLVGVLAIASQPSFREQHLLFSGLKLDRIRGTPEDFTVRVGRQQARVLMSRPGTRQILYQADLKLEKLKLSITGQAWALLRLHYDEASSPALSVDLTVAFKPSSAILAAALKPMLAAFKAEMDRLTQRVLVVADDFLKVYRSELAGSFSQSALLAQAAELIDRNRQLENQMQGRAGAAGPTEAFADWRGWLLGIGGLLAALVLGGLLGRWLAGRRRTSRVQARSLRRQMQEQEAREHELAQALAGHRAVAEELSRRLEDLLRERAELRRLTREAVEDPGDG